MTLNQLQQYIVGVLQGWVTNKSILDKFSETADGKLLYNGMEIGSGGDTFITDQEVAQKIADTLAALNKENPAPVVLSVNVNKETGDVTVDGLVFTCNAGTEITDIAIAMDEPIFIADGAEPIITQIVTDSTGTVITSIDANYGTFAIDGSTIIVTPKEEFAVTPFPGVINFTIPSGVIIDQLGKSKAYTFTLTIIDPLASTYQPLDENTMVLAPMGADGYDEYSVIMEEELDATKTNIVTVTVKNMKVATNPAGVSGVWGGFFIEGPENAKGYKSKFSRSEVNVLDIINGSPKAMDKINGKLGYCCYGDWAKSNVYYGVLQFHGDAECTQPITPVYKFKVVLSEDSVFIEE